MGLKLAIQTVAWKRCRTFYQFRSDLIHLRIYKRDLYNKEGQSIVLECRVETEGIALYRVDRDGKKKG